MLHPRIGGVWARSIGHFGDVTIVDAWPHGNESASWKMPSGTENPALRMNAPVEILDGGLVVWRGVLDEPGEDGAMTAKGLWTLAQDCLALDSAGNPTRVPDVAIDAAIARGALPGWKRPASLSATAWGANDAADLTVAQLLDNWSQGAGLRWAVDSRGIVFAQADPTVVTWRVPTAAAGRPLTLAEDSYVTHLYGRYLSAADTVTTVIAANTTAAAKWGRREMTVDLAPMGVISSTVAQQQVDGMLALSGGRLHFAEGLELLAGQITTRGNAPASLTQVKAGQRVRLMGVPDRSRPTGFAAYTDIVLGKVSYTDGSDKINIEPVDMAPRNLSDILKVAVSEDEAVDSGARAQVNAVADTVNTNINDTGWIGLPLINGWTNYGGQYQSAQYRRKNGVVYLRGLIVGSGRTNNVAANLPAGFRHSGGDQIWNCSSDAASLTTRMDTNAIGNLFFIAGGTAFISLAQIKYPVDA